MSLGHDGDPLLSRSLKKRNVPFSMRIPEYRLRILLFRQAAQDSLFKRTSAHVAIWLLFGVCLSVAPFVWAWLTHNPRHDIGWGDIIHPHDLVLISIALAAGASGELFLRTVLSPELKFTLGAWICYPLSLALILAGTYLYGTVTKPGAVESAADIRWCWTVFAAGLIIAAFTIIVNERAEHYSRLSEGEVLERREAKRAKLYDRLRATN